MATTTGAEKDAWANLAAADKPLAYDLLLRVRRGVALLDRIAPGWHGRIAVDRLSMESCDECILGQLCGDFVVGCREVAARLPRDTLFTSSVYGFGLRPEEQPQDDRFAALGDLWRREIRSRLAGEGVAVG